MDKENSDPYASTARWLAESGKRPSPDARGLKPAPESSEMLLQYLEEQTGRSLRSREDIRHFISDLTEHSQERLKESRNRQLVRDAALLAVLAFSVLQFYYMDFFLQIDRLNRVTVFLPTRDLAHRDART
jgi:hypothetical protein